MEERFWDYVQIASYCWEWVGAKTRHGYGHLKVEGKMIKAHRISWELAFGPIPDGMFVLHHCDNPPCVNPAHLWLGTNADNMKDRWDKGRFSFGSQFGEHNSFAKLTEDDVRQIRALRGKTTIKELAKQFEVHFSNISAIQLRKTWKHLK